MVAHVARRHVAGIDRRKPGSEQRDKRRLRPLQVERHLVIAVGADLLQILVPDLARIDPKLFARLAGEQVPGALHVFPRKGLAVVPFDAFAQPKRQLCLVLVP
jgi:hypothetical protein